MGLLVLLVLAGCTTPGPRSRFLEEIAPASITNLTAYCVSNSVEIRYPLKGNNAYAHANWRLEPWIGTDYQCQFAVLGFEREKRSARKLVVGRGNRLAVRDARQWNQLLLGVFNGLAPGEPGHGALLLNQEMELVLYRGTNGVLKVVPLHNKPPKITIDHTYSDQDFSREAIKLLAAGVQSVQPNQSRYLFMTGTDPTFVLVDPGERLIMFLSYPTDPEAVPIKVPGTLALRALNSILIKSFLITAIKNPVSLASRGLWHLGSSGMTLMSAMPGESSDPPSPLYQGLGMDLAAWERDLDGLVAARRYKGQVQLLVDGRRYFPELIQSIEDAKHSVDVMVYIFDTDPYAVKIADVLKQVSKSVPVRVLMDDLGSSFAGGAPASVVPPDFQAPADIKSYLKAGSRVRVRASSDPWLATDHRKCIIIDSRQAYVGGMNIGWVYRYDWHDMMVGVTGPVVGRLEKDYREAWAFSGPLGDFAYAWAGLFDREHLRRNARPGDIDIRVLRTATGETQIYRAQLAAIQRAKRYIYIENAYFNDNAILSELIAARRRGVDVRVILPADNDVGVMQTGNLVMANEMLSQGIRVYLYPGMTHVKAAVYDGWACVGSANLEKMSLRVSQEMDIAFSDPVAVEHLNQDLFDPDFKRAQELKVPVTLNWLDPLIKALANQL